MRLNPFFKCLIFLPFFCGQTFSQDLSNKGKDFWVAFPGHVAAQSAVLGLYISTDGAAATVNISVGSISFPAFVVQPNTIERRYFGPSIINPNYQLNTNVTLHSFPDNIVPSTANPGPQRLIHITSDKPIVVFSHIIENNRSGSTLVYPTSVWGKEYIVPSFASTTGNINNSQGIPELAIFASRPNTQIRITPTANSRTLTRPAGVPYVITLPNVGDVYHIQYSPLSDISGTLVESLDCSPIAVVSASTWSSFGCTIAGTGDNLYQQLLPTTTWGKRFVTSPIRRNPTVSTDQNVDIFRVFVKDPTTVVQKTENGVTSTLTGYSTTGRYYQFSSSQGTIIDADKPIQVIQYITTRACGNPATDADPEMIVLTSVEQTIDNVTVLSATNLTAPTGQTNVTSHFINAVMKSADAPTFRVNGALPSALPGNAGVSWIPIPPTNEYSYLKLNVTSAAISAGTNPVFSLTATGGFNAIAYGFGNPESYGYNAGTNAKNLYQYQSITNGTISSTLGIVCVGTPFKFSITLPFQPTRLEWQFGATLNNLGITNYIVSDPSFSSTSTVNGVQLYTYELPSQYSISTPSASYAYKVLVTSVNQVDGCIGTREIDFDFQAVETPLANFNFSGTCVNSPTQFTFTGNAAGRPIATYNWSFGSGGGASTDPNPSYTYPAAGTYTTTLFYTTDIGCKSNESQRQVTINPLPTGFVIGSATTCLNAPTLPVTFEGSGGTAPYTFFYTINGGATLSATSSSGNNLTVQAPTTSLGIYQYTLTAISESGPGQCQSILASTATITINTNPSATITGTTEVCKGAAFPPVTFTGSDGTPPYTFTYNINGGPSLVASTLSSSSSTALLISTVTPGTFTYNLTGVVDVNNTVCSGSPTGSATVIVNDLPTATISGTTSVCLAATEPQITFTGANGTAPYTFFYTINGAGTLSVTSNGNTATVSVPTTTAGTFTYTLQSVRDASVTACTQPQSGTAVVTVWPRPQAAYTTSSPVCQAGTISFTDQSIANVGTVTGWSWNFGDPVSGGQNTSTLQSPLHFYASAGTYTITLTVTTSNGCVSVNAVAPLVVHPKPRAGYIIPEVCLSDTYALFTDTSSVASPSTVTAWLWNFGNPNANPPANPNTSTLQNPQHSYTAVGNYNVSLIVTSSQGCKDTINQQLTVNGSFPVASFAVNNPTTLCANDSVRITNNSTVLPGVITKVEIWWDNVGAPSVVYTDDNPVFGGIYSHRYPNFQTPLTKTYQIKFRAYSGGVCMREVTQNITVNAAPKVQFNAIPNICFDAPLYQITQASEIGNVPGSGVFSGSGVTAAGVFSPASVGAGTYSISYLYTSTAGGCKDSLTRTIKVWERALADFTVTTEPFCERQPITFTSTASSTEGTLTQWVWNFANGAGVFTTTSAAALTRTYATYGTYDVKLNVVTSNGCVSADKIITVVVKPLARPNFSFPAISCLPNANVQFTNLSTVPNAAPSSLTYLWNFGDPPSGTVNTSTAVDPSHVYVDLGPYNVKLTATTSDGCIHDTTFVLNTIHPQPIASFTTDAIDVCIGAPFLFTSTSDPVDGTIQSYSWDLADGATRTLGSFSYTYADTGTYTVSHFIINSFGCKSTIATKTIYVNGYPDADAGPDKLMLEGGQVQLTPPNNYPMPVSFAWTPPTYLDDPTRIDPTARPPDDITYLLTVTSNKGCSDTSSVFVKVLKDPPVPNIFSPNGDGVHDTWIIPYLDSYPGCTVEVVNRYGNLVFRSVGYATPWDGKVKGKDVPMGTYYFVIDPKNGRKKKAGYVDIIR